MADIDIRELRAYEPYCVDCGETGPIETSSFLAFAWEQAHDCATAAQRRGGRRQLDHSHELAHGRRDHGRARAQQRLRHRRGNPDRQGLPVVVEGD